MSRRFTIISRNAFDTDQLLSVLPPDEPVRVLRARSWPPSSQPAAVGRALLPLLRADSVIILGSGQDERDLAGWLAMNLDAPVLWAVESVQPAGDGIETVRTVSSGALRVVQGVGAGPVLVLAKPTESSPRRLHVTDEMDVTVEPFDVEEDTNGVALLSAPDNQCDQVVPLAGADVVVSVGRGIGSYENINLFRDLASRLGAALGASRVAVDSGWLPFAHQVGQTGATVAPAVYLAFGISGAVQHLAGMRGSQKVVAINTDREAPLCRVADLVVEGDAVTVATELLNRLAPRSTGQSTAASGTITEGPQS